MAMARKLVYIPVGAVATAITLILVCWLLSHYIATSRSKLGRVVRWWRGKPLAMHWAKDIGTDTAEKIGLNKLQVWTKRFPERYQSGNLATNGKAPYWAKGRIKLNQDETPDCVKKAWYHTPVISVRISDDNEPTSLALSWYLYGLLVGDEGYTETKTDEFCYLKELKPGIYVYAIEK